MEIVIAVLGCTAFWQLIDHIIEARRKKKFDVEQAIKDIQSDLAAIQDDQAVLKHQLEKIEKDTVRIQLKDLMRDWPENEEECMTVAQHYFVDLKANWWMSMVFNRWLAKNSIGRPEWLKK